LTMIVGLITIFLIFAGLPEPFAIYHELSHWIGYVVARIEPKFLRLHFIPKRWFRFEPACISVRQPVYARQFVPGAMGPVVTAVLLCALLTVLMPLHARLWLAMMILMLGLAANDIYQTIKIVFDQNYPNLIIYDEGHELFKSLT
ncbi:MAG: hypothetical protein ACYDH2_12600, partial [Anaerolineaceae bacterium]